MVERGFHLAEGHVVGEKNFARLEASEKQGHQDDSQDNEQPNPRPGYEPAVFSPGLNPG